MELGALGGPFGSDGGAPVILVFELDAHSQDFFSELLFTVEASAGFVVLVEFGEGRSPELTQPFLRRGEAVLRRLKDDGGDVGFKDIGVDLDFSLFVLGGHVRRLDHRGQAIGPSVFGQRAVVDEGLADLAESSGGQIGEAIVDDTRADALEIGVTEKLQALVTEIDAVIVRVVKAALVRKDAFLEIRIEDEREVR